MPETIRVAILGGGIAGCTLANGLLKHENIVFDIFDAKSTFGERGAGVALAPNAVKSLYALGLDVPAAFKEAQAMEMTSTYCLIGLGENIGKPILELPGGVYTVTRSLWLDTLLKRLPQDRLHSGKSLVSVDSSDTEGPYTLRFADGSDFEADAVIGCDGIRSKVREVVLGGRYPDRIAPIFGGYWDARGRMTPQEAADQFGTELFDPARPSDVALVGEGAFLLFGPSEDGKIYHVIISATAGPGYDETAWKASLTKEFLEESYKHWDEKYRIGIIKCLLEDESSPGVVFSQWESAEAPTYYKNCICMLGDAAHATVPWLGQGACMAVEDVAVMAALLGSVQHPRELQAAIKAFDSIRRGRPEHVIRKSHEAAKLLTGALSMNPADVAHLEAHQWWTQIWDIDMEAHIRDAVKTFEGFK